MQLIGNCYENKVKQNSSKLSYIQTPKGVIFDIRYHPFR